MIVIVTVEWGALSHLIMDKFTQAQVTQAMTS